MNSNINNKNQGYARFANYQSPIRPNNQNIYKNLNISNLQQQAVEQEPSQQQDTNEWNEYFTYVGNIQPSKMRANELNALIDGCLNKLYQKQKYQVEINSVSTYSDAIYVSFKCESDAIEAANYFHGMTLRSGQEPLESYYFDRCLSLNFRKNDDTSNSENNKSSFDEGYENESARMRFKAVKTECELLISNRQLKKYADSVNEKLNKELFGISTCVKYINKTTDDVDEIVNTDLIKDALDRNLLYLIYINQANEQFNSINLIVVNKWRFVYRQFAGNGRKINHSIKENKNMPLNRAIDFLKSDYHDYIGYLKEMESTRRVNKKRKQSGQEDDENEERETEKEDEDGYSYLPPTKKTLLDQVLTRFVECRQVGVNDLDFLLTYLGREKRELIDETFNYGVDNSYQQTQNTSIPPLIQSSALAPPPPPPPPQQPPPPLPPAPSQQAPPLMSLMNSSGASQTPSLMSLNMASSGLNYSNSNNNFNHNNKFNSNNMMYTNKKF